MGVNYGPRVVKFQKILSSRYSINRRKKEKKEKKKLSEILYLENIFQKVYDGVILHCNVHTKL